MNCRGASVYETGSNSLICDFVLAAVVLPESFEGFHTRRKDRFNYLIQYADVGIGRVSVEEIDKYGLDYCRKILLNRAINNLNVPPKLITVSETMFGLYKHPNMVIAKDNDRALQEAMFISKYLRNVDVDSLCVQHPDLAFKYGWKSNRGYLSDVHCRGIVIYGKSIHHRKICNV